MSVQDSRNLLDILGSKHCVTKSQFGINAYPNNPGHAVVAPPGLARHYHHVPRSQQHRGRLRLPRPPAEEEHARLPQGHGHEGRIQVPLGVVGVATCRV